MKYAYIIATGVGLASLTFLVGLELGRAQGLEAAKTACSGVFGRFSG